MNSNITRVGSKYFRTIHNRADVEGSNKTCVVDVYRVIDAFGVTDPCVQHAIKKILCAGLRDKNSQRKDLEEAIESIEQAIALHDQKLSQSPVSTKPTSEKVFDNRPIPTVGG